MTGVSFNDMLGNKKSSVRDEKSNFGIESLENKAYYKGDWKIRFLMPPFGEGRNWQLFNIKEDPEEQRDLATRRPDKLHEMLSGWIGYTQSVGYIPFYGCRAYSVLGAENFFKAKLDSTNKALIEKATMALQRGGE